MKTTHLDIACLVSLLFTIRITPKAHLFGHYSSHFIHFSDANKSIIVSKYSLHSKLLSVKYHIFYTRILLHALFR